MILPRAAAGRAYRPDIDGLRAVAILGVVLFHYRIGGVSGGFAGVDVFFVISGFLITRLIHGEMAEGRFRLTNFYQRRVRRIFPALVVMLAAASAAAAWLLFASDFERFARTLAATAVFGTNIELWRQTGYFDAAARTKPLLHLWSIAVEEQFYLLFPLVLLLVRRASRRWQLSVLALLGLASFGWSMWGVTHAPAATFYLLPSRIWELMLGAILAVGGWAPARRSMRETAGALGLGLIVASGFAITSATPFPGPAALLPCLGAGLVIYAAGGFAGRFLASRPLVFLGLISYSLYLWHWPLLVFSRYVFYRALSVPERFGLIALSLVLAVLSWRFVEQPFRRARIRPLVLFPLGGGDGGLRGPGGFGDRAQGLAGSHAQIHPHHPGRTP